jgi:integrase
VDKPRAGEGDAEVRYLEDAELEALLRATLNTPIERTDHTLYLTAAMTGMRPGAWRAPAHASGMDGPP